MIPILIISFFMWLLIINRVLFLHRLYVRNITRDKAGELVKANQMPDENTRVPIRFW